MKKEEINKGKPSINNNRSYYERQLIKKRNRIKIKRMMKRFMILIFLAIITVVYFIDYSKVNAAGDSVDNSNESKEVVVDNSKVKTKGVVSIKGSSLTLANKQYVLEKKYVPKDMVKVNVTFSEGVTEEEQYMTKDASKALEKLVQGAAKENIILYGLSGYRSYDTQKTLYEYNVKVQGQEYADKYVAKPGSSEHQLGEAMDLAASWGWIYEGCEEAKWIASNAYKYGFIVRYEAGKEKVTGYNYEPWHVRYVGKNAAKEIFDGGKSLEEYGESY
ncbi:MAG: M15 family metallopeptidase [Clostridium sp.]|uniref:M15 family metallopeptidase n=1 Tax=Clostridium sp. TaxID=1506 RepID=UPI0030615513